MTRRRVWEGIMKLKIGWKKYTIIKKKKPKMGKELVNGSIDSDALEIQIEKSLPIEVQQQVLIHEVIHGIFNHAGKQEWFKNEELVDCISNGIMQVIYDNETNIFEKIRAKHGSKKNKNRRNKRV